MGTADQMSGVKSVEAQAHGSDVATGGTLTSVRGPSVFWTGLKRLRHELSAVCRVLRKSLKHSTFLVHIFCYRYSFLLFCITESVDVQTLLFQINK